MYGIRGKYFQRKDLDNIKRQLNPENYLHKEDGLSTYSTVVSSMDNDGLNSPFLLFKGQGVDHFFCRKTANASNGTTPLVFTNKADVFKKWRDDPLNNIDIYEALKTAKHLAASQLGKDEMMLVIQNDEQRNIYLKNGGECIYVDASHSLTAYGFYLLSLVVEDVDGHGRLVATCITSSTSGAAVQAFLESIKENCPTVTPKYAMTDDDNAEWNAISAVFNDIIILLCQWHVRKSWSKNLTANGVHGSAFEELNGDLESLIGITKRADFELAVNNFVSKHIVTQPKFIAYFQKHWLQSSQRKNAWSSVLRFELRVSHLTTNNFVESFHKILKYDDRYFKGKKNARCDKLIKVILQFISDQDDQIEYYRIFGTRLTNFRRQYALEQGTALMEDDDFSCLMDHDQVDESTESGELPKTCQFYVSSKSDSNIQYTVSYNKICHCQFSDQVFCNHAFSCSCSFNRNTNRPCGHIGSVFLKHKDILQGTRTARLNTTTQDSSAVLPHTGRSNAVLLRKRDEMNKLIGSTQDFLSRLTLQQQQFETLIQGCDVNDSFERIHVVENLDTLARMMTSICNVAKVESSRVGCTAVAAPSVTGTAFVAKEYVAPGSFFVKQKLYPTQARKGRKAKQKMHGISPKERTRRTESLLMSTTAALQEQGNEWESCDDDNDDDDDDDDDDGDHGNDNGFPARNDLSDYQTVAEEFYQRKIFRSPKDCIETDDPDSIAKYFSSEGLRMYRLGASDTYKWLHARQDTDPTSKVCSCLNLNPNALNNVTAVQNGKQNELKAIMIFHDVFRDRLMKHPENAKVVQNILLGTCSIIVNPVVPFLVSQIDGRLHIYVHSDAQHLFFPHSSGIFVKVLVPQDLPAFATEDLNLKIWTINVEVKCPATSNLDELHANTTATLRRNKHGHLMLHEESKAYYQVITGLALSERNVAYFVVYLDSANIPVSENTDDFLFFQVIQFDVAAQSAWKQWLPKLLHCWCNICLLPLALYEKYGKIPKNVAAICTLEDMQDTEFQGFKFLHPELFKLANLYLGNEGWNEYALDRCHLFVDAIIS